MKWYFEEIIQISNIGVNIKAFEATHNCQSDNFFADALGFEFAGYLIDGGARANAIVDE